MALPLPTRRQFVLGAALPIRAALSAREAHDPAPDLTALEQGFLTPPSTYRLWVYWWWLNGNLDEHCITRDLEQMKQKGVGGLLMFDSRRYGVELLPPPPPLTDFMSDRWRGLLKFAMQEASRLGLEMSMNLSTHGGTLRSPWATGAEAPKKLVWTSAEIQGPGRVTSQLRRPEKKYFWDVALLAVRRAGSETASAAPSVDLSSQWHDASEEEPRGAPALEVLDLSSSASADGRLTWDAGEGHWTLLRFACVTIDDREMDVDILSSQAVENHFERMGRKILEDAGALAGNTLTHFYNVSWEGASPTWTPGFEKEFEKYCGYNLHPYLPVLAGIPVQSLEVSARFLEDYSRALSSVFLNNCYGKLNELCHRAGLKWHSESGGPWDRRKLLFARADQLAFWGRNDTPQGEFWYPNPRQTNCRRTAMAAHIYERPVAAAEAFTHMVHHWSAYPAVLKPRGDAAFIDGINHLIWHTFSASPEPFGKPGIVYFAGTHLNPNVTWWEQAGAFLEYLGRCQFLLRQGRFVADVCVYTSDRNYADWGRDESWSPRASLTLPKGYTYDLLNTEVLVGRLSVRSAALALPGGMQYRLLVVDPEEEAIPVAPLRKIIELARAGATVVLGRRRPTRSVGLAESAASDAEVRRLAGELWGDGGEASFRRPLGKGKVIGGVSLERVLQEEGIAPDFAGPWEYNHRRDGDTDIYFVVGQGRAECTFRVSRKEPELWDPVTGTVRDAVCYRRTADGRTTVPLELPENGSVFVVFRRPALGRHVISVSAPPGDLEVAGRTQAGIRVRVWKTGRYVLETSTKQRLEIEAHVPDAIALPGPWAVAFAPGWGAPDSAIFERLLPWNEHPDEGIRYFSGSAVYRKTFELDEVRAGRRVLLRLGQVRNIARVRLNGKALGVVWTAPWAADLSGAVRTGRNELEVEVTNLWVNRLIGDAALPEEKRLTKTIVRRDPAYKGRHPHLRGYLATDPLAGC